MVNNNRYWLFLCACLLIGLVQVTTKMELASARASSNAYAEQRFLGYIAEARSEPLSVSIICPTRQLSR